MGFGAEWLGTHRAKVVAWIGTTVFFVALDSVSGPYLAFPILYLVPVILACWVSGPIPAVALAVALPLVRGILETGWDVPWSTSHVVLNGLVRTTAFALGAIAVWRIREQHRALSRQVETLTGLLPICSFCKKIRDDSGEWQRLERYIGEHSEATFTHGLCPRCFDENYPEYAGDAPEPNKPR